MSSKNLNDPGRPSEVIRSYRMAEPVPYVDWTPDRESWMDEAACLGELDWVDLAVKLAKMICAQCPVREACLARRLGLRSLPQFGVWGGLTPQELRERQQPLVVTADAA